ncbi:plasma membrane ATPase 1-like [Dorcoceras hygrometricum]|uniref:Plasma membrane ATPase 1-like n=1 Tax=Dorcoceras hygrometricum TaxID=472368 RepID=A0A2Z7D9B0_9LAMI|nr:plasma membrane ATPase 1-like [Dorcoceras hygrometricum]
MFLVDRAVKMRIRPPELETSICDAKYHVSLSTTSVLGKCVYLVTLAMSLFNLQDVCIAIGSIATLDLPMVVDLIGIYGLKGPYSTLLIHSPSPLTRNNLALTSIQPTSASSSPYVVEFSVLWLEFKGVWSNPLSSAPVGPSGSRGGPAGRAQALVAGVGRTNAKTSRWSRRRSMAGASTCSDHFSLVSPWFEPRLVTLEPSRPGGGPVGRAPAVVAGAGRTVS